MAKPPVRIANIMIGDGSLSSDVIFELVPSLSILETYPQIIGYDPEVYNYFKEQWVSPVSIPTIRSSSHFDRSDLCGFNINLTYPQNGLIPDIPLVMPTGREIPLEQLKRGKNRMSQLSRRSTLEKRTTEEREAARQEWKRDISQRPKGVIDPWVRNVSVYFHIGAQTCFFFSTVVFFCWHMPTML